MIDVSVGGLIIKANFYMDGITNQWDWKVGTQYCVSDQVKESLLNCIDLIKDKKDRAEIALSIMAR